MKLYVNITGLTKITAFDDNNNIVFEKNCTYPEILNILDAVSQKYQAESFDKIYITGPSKLTERLMNSMTPTFTKAMYCMEGGRKH
mgnify:CR=1 FL=1